jgi:arginine decarboxylase
LTTVPRQFEDDHADDQADSSDSNHWTIQKSRALYGIGGWGGDYFDIDASGDVNVTAPTAGGNQSVAISTILDGLNQRGLKTPVMLRIENLIDDRVVKLNTVFAKAIADANYRGDYRSVFPIKVNQQHNVVDSIGRSGQPFNHGLEAGSKAELLVAISSVTTKDSLIVCNGYKDEEFIDLGFTACQLGYKCFFVLETLEELDLIIRRARHFGVRPMIGARVKLTTKVQGHWAGDSGDRSLFGLQTVELISVVDRLRENEMLDCFGLLHFHLGSQLTNIRNIRDGLKEACQYYIGLVQDGVPLKYLDLGGGLAVDYDGTASTEPHSRNYDLEEYAVDVVETVMTSLDAYDIDHPVIVTESGRWTVAPMSVLIFNILAVTNFEPDDLPDQIPEGLCDPIRWMLETFATVGTQRLQESYNDALYYRDQLRKLFSSGKVTLRERAFGENLYLKIVKEINQRSGELDRMPSDLAELNESLSDIYYGNFSVFQSLPDAWAIEQVFPVMPLHRLNEEPKRKAIIADLTCDCDGKLDRFVGGDGEIKRTLQLHELNPDQPYYVGVFLVGAYQETLGDMHNLFGDNNVASIRITDKGAVEFVQEVPGDSISDVISYVEYDPQQMLARFRMRAEEAVRAQQITVQARQQMVQLFRDSLRGYTYFEE